MPRGPRRSSGSALGASLPRGRELLYSHSPGALIGPQLIWRSIAAPALPYLDMIDCGAVWDSSVLLVDVTDGSGAGKYALCRLGWLPAASIRWP